MQWWGIACGRLKKKLCFLFFYSTDAVLLSFFFSGLWSMVGSGRMPPGPSVMYEFVSSSVCAVFVEADLSLLRQSVKSKHTSPSKERNTQIKIVFLSTRKKKITSQVSGVSSAGMRMNFHFMMFFFLKGKIIVSIYSTAPGSLFLCLSSSDVKSLGTVSIKLCQSKHEII